MAGVTLNTLNIMSITIHLIKRSYSDENYEEVLNNISITRNATIPMESTNKP